MNFFFTTKTFKKILLHKNIWQLFHCETYNKKKKITLCIKNLILDSKLHRGSLKVGALIKRYGFVLFIFIKGMQFFCCADDGLGCWQDINKLLSMFSYLKHIFHVVSRNVHCCIGLHIIQDHFFWNYLIGSNTLYILCSLNKYGYFYVNMAYYFSKTNYFC